MSGAYRILAGGHVFLFDERDRPLAERFNWFTWAPPGGRLRYVVRKVRLASGLYTKRMFHREVLGITDPSVEVDHWDSNGLRNRRGNLRVATASQNQANARKHLDATTSKFKGVVHRKDGPFQAQIQHQKRRYYLGCFQTEEDAARAYNAAAQKFFGPFTLLNKI